MTQPQEVTVIDLCSSDEDNDGDESKYSIDNMIDNQEATKRERIISVSSEENDSDQSSIKKRRKKDDRNVHDSGLPKPLVFLRAVGGDDGTVTEGLYYGLAVLQTTNNHNLKSCCSYYLSKANLKSSINSSAAATAITTAVDEQRELTLLHIGQRDKWSCGYRNLQMFLAALVPTLDPGHSYVQSHSSNVTIDAGRVVCFEIPSLPELEGELEASWKAGFDKSGAEHYRGRVQGRSKWIGAVEVWSILTASGIDACVVQFIRCLESRRLLGTFCSAYFATTCPWCVPNIPSASIAHQILNQASSKSHVPMGQSICTCPRLPLYLQWEGHSVTIVGVEHSKMGVPINLLLMDPAKKGSNLVRSLQSGEIAPLRLGLAGLRGKDCQIILANRRNLSRDERQGCKSTINAVTAAPDAVKKTY